MITLYHLENSRSQRVVWLLEELGCSYQIVAETEQHSNTLPQDILPLKFPTIRVQNAEHAFYLTETSAICEFLAQKFQQLIPNINKTDKDCANFYFWKNYADASLMQLLVLKQVFKQITSNTPFIFKPISYLFQIMFDRMYLNNALAQQLERVNAVLEKNDWICGDKFTIADILLWFPLEASMVSVDVSQYSSVQRYLAQIKMRVGFSQALKRGNWSNEAFKRYWA